MRRRAPWQAPGQSAGELPNPPHTTTGPHARAPRTSALSACNTAHAVVSLARFQLKFGGSRGLARRSARIASLAPASDGGAALRVLRLELGARLER